MSTTADERLVVMLEARVSEFEKRMRQAEGRGTNTYQRLRRGSRDATRAMERDMVQSTGRINQALTATGTRVTGFARTLAAGFAGGLVAGAVAGLTSQLQGAVRAIAEVGDQARRAGVGVEAFQRWRAVAAQARIGVDQLADGFRELNLRADEWVTTGGGSAADAFERLGFTATDLRDRLQDPSELMLEIMRRMRHLDTAARIRVADEIFGGSAGERFVELLGRSQTEIRQMMTEADTLSEAQITRAQELDREYTRLMGNLRTGWQHAVIGTANFLAQLANIRGSLDDLAAHDLFQNPAQAEMMLGEGIVGALDTEGVAAHADAIRDMIGLYNHFAASAQMVQPALRRLSAELHGAGYTEAGEAVHQLAEGMDVLIAGFEGGTVSAEGFEEGMAHLIARAQETLTGVQDLDSPTFERVTARLRDLAAMLTQVKAEAEAARRAMPGSAHGQDTGDPLPFVVMPPGTPPAPTPPTLTRPPRGGGGARDNYGQATTQIREQTEALNLQAAALVAAGIAGEDYATAIEYARQRAELMSAALRDGREITPALQAEIDALARAYVGAGNAAQTAAEQMQGVEERAERGAERVVDLFGQMARGGDVAREAVLRLIAELLRMRAIEGLSGVAKGGGGGWLGAIVRAFGFAAGGYTGDGPMMEPAGIVHRGEYVMSKAAVQRLGAGNLEALHQRTLKGFAQGGLVGGAAPRPMPGQSNGRAAGAAAVDVRIHTTVSVDDEGKLKAMVHATAEKTSQAVVAGALDAHDRQVLPQRVKDILDDPYRTSW